MGNLNMTELSATPAEIARQGWSVVVPGDVFNHMCVMLETVLLSHQLRDRQLLMDLAQLHDSLIVSAVPVRAKPRS